MKRALPLQLFSTLRHIIIKPGPWSEGYLQAPEAATGHRSTLRHPQDVQCLSQGAAGHQEWRCPIRHTYTFANFTLRNDSPIQEPSASSIFCRVRCLSTIRPSTPNTDPFCQLPALLTIIACFGFFSCPRRRCIKAGQCRTVRRCWQSWSRWSQRGLDASGRRAPCSDQRSARRELRGMARGKEIQEEGGRVA